MGLKQLNAASLSWVLLSFLLVQGFKLKIIPLIILSVGFGSIWYFLGF